MTNPLLTKVFFLGKGGHLPVELTFKIPRTYSIPTTQYSKRIVLKKLEKEDIRIECEQKIIENFTRISCFFDMNIQSRVQHSDKAADTILSDVMADFHKSLLKAASDTLGVRSSTYKTSQASLSMEIRMHINKIKALDKLIKKATGSARLILYCQKKKLLKT